MIKKQPIVSLLEDDFVSYIIDAERGDGYKLANEYKIAAFPTILYLNSEGEEISRYVGLPGEHKVLQLTKSAIQAEDKFREMKQKE
jgi:thioredoxin-related protein